MNNDPNEELDDEFEFWPSWDGISVILIRTRSIYGYI